MKTTKSLLLFAMACAAANADVVVSLNTTGLTGPGPWALGFQFIDGGVLGNNTATISNVTLGGGSAGAVQTSNGASGNIGTSVSMDNSVFFGEFTQGFTPGSLLTFQLGLTNNFDGLTPDLFALVLFNNGTQVLTADPGGTFLYVELNGVNPLVYNVFASDPLSGFTIAAPTVGPTGPPSIPEPSTYAMAALALCGAGWLRFRSKS